jgi:plasmid stabilization system protein ParE
MGWPVILTPQAEEDLRDVEIFIGRRSPQDAVRFCNALAGRALSLANFPSIGRLVPELDDPAIREIIHGSYRIVYELRAEPDRVFVLRFWHAARGVPEPFG